MEDSLNAIKTHAHSTLQELHDAEALPQWYRQFLGRKGELTAWLHHLKGVSAAERPRLGQLGNALKGELQQAFALRQEALKSQAMASRLRTSALDVTLPGRVRGPGRLHPLTRMQRRIRQIFAEMGFQVFESREVESDTYNFTLLNIPPYHPARDMWDTFWVNEQAVLRTHTSPGQIRAMRRFHPEPIRVILPGKVYRYEDVSARSEHQFFQVEGLAIGHQIRLSDLIGVMQEFANRMYGGKRRLRIRSSYFPFTEPSIEIDVNWDRPGGVVDKNSGWLEIAGAGMIHPRVLQNGGYDPQVWSGFAFGMGVERPAMLFHGVDDIRYFYRNDLRFLQQFGA